MKVLTKIGALAVLMCSGTVLAQPTITISTENVAPSATANVQFDYVGDGTQAGVTFNILYDANLTVVDTDGVTPGVQPCLAGAAGFVNCNDLGGGIIAVAIANATPQPTGSWMTIGFTAPAAPGNYPVSGDQTTVNYSPGGNIGTIVAGAVVVAAGPGPGVLNVQPPALNPATAAVNGPATTGMITVSNDGVAGDATFTANCSLGAVTGTPGVNISVPALNMALAPTVSQNVTASCSGTAAGSAMATYTCTPTGSPTITNNNTVITCNTMAGIPVANPAPGSNVSLLVGPVVRGGSGTATQTFSETANPGAGYDVTCTVTDTGGGAFALMGSGMVSVPSGGTAGVTVSGQSSAMDPQPTGTMTCVYSNGVTGTVTVALGISLIPEIVPTLSQWGLILMILALVGFGAYRVRRTNVA